MKVFLTVCAAITGAICAPVKKHELAEDVYLGADGELSLIKRGDVPAGAEYKTVTTEVNGKFGTYLQVVYTSTIRPARTYTFTKTFYSTLTYDDGSVTTIESVSHSTSTQAPVYATVPVDSNGSSSSNDNEQDDSSDDSETQTQTQADSPSASSSTIQQTAAPGSSTSSSSSTTGTTSTTESQSSVVKVTASVSYSFPTTTSTSSSSTITNIDDGSMDPTASYTPYYTDTIDNGVCIVYYAEDDETESYDDTEPYTTITITSVVATVTLTKN